MSKKPIIPRSEWLRLLEFAAELFNTSSEAICTYNSKQDILIDARKCLAAALVQVYGMSNTDISKLLLCRSGESVGHWMRKYHSHCETDKCFRGKANKVIVFGKIHRKNSHIEICPFCKNEIKNNEPKTEKKTT